MPGISFPWSMFCSLAYAMNMAGFIWGFPKMGLPQNHGFQGFNTKMVYFWMIWGTPILGNIHMGDIIWVFS